MSDELGHLFEPAHEPPDYVERASAREMTVAERVSFLDRVCRQELVSAAELAPQRAKVFWRTTRALALMKGHLRAEQFLIEGLQAHPKNWLLDPLGFESSGLRVVGTDLADLLSTPTQLPLHPGRLTTQGEIERLQQAHLLIAYHLGVTRFEDGQQGLRWMDSQDYFVPLFPSTAAILEYERSFIDRASNVLLNKSPKALSLWLRDVQGLSHQETRMVSALARRWIVEMHAGSQDERKATMLARLHSVLGRARKAFDLKTELATLKQIAIVEGLGALAAQDQQTEFIKLLQKTGDGAHEALPNAGSQPPSGGEAGKLHLGIQADRSVDSDGGGDDRGGDLVEQD